MVRRLRVNGNPKKYVRWTCLDRILSLPGVPQGEAPLPFVTHFSVEVGRKARGVELAPLLGLVANPMLQQVWVSPNRSKQYPLSTLEDAQVTFSILTRAFRGECPLQWLAFYPQSKTNEHALRTSLTNSFLPLSTSLRIFTTSIWFFSLPLLSALAQAPLERLEIQGDPSAYHVDLPPMEDTVFPDGAFQRLRMLLLQDVPLMFARKLIKSQQLIDYVEVLSIELAKITEIGFEEDEDTSYIILAQRLAALPALQELTVASSQSEGANPWSINMGLLQPILHRQLRVLRLYRIGLQASTGFQQLLTVSAIYWANLTVLCVMHQDISGGDLYKLALLPSLQELSANISRLLTAHVDREPFAHFQRPLTLTSQFRFQSPYRHQNDQDVVDQIARCAHLAQSGCNASHSQCCSLLDSVTSVHGLVLLVDRVFVEGLEADKHDTVWASQITRRASQLGVKVPYKVALLKK
jgi:hypothetical protein